MQDGKFVILCVDDDLDLLLAITALLDFRGYLPIAATNLEKGWRMFLEDKPDLIIIDLMMEEIDSGKLLAAKIREYDSTVPIYLLSSVADQLTGQIDAQSLGLSGAMQKPIDPEILLHTLQTKLHPAD